MSTSSFYDSLRSDTGFQTATGVSIRLTSLIAIYSLSVVTSLPGLAVSPILGELTKVFPLASQMEIQMLESLPSLVIIPFILLAGKLSVGFDMRRLVFMGLGLFVVSSIVNLLPIGIGLLLANSVILGIGAGVVIPLSTGLIAHYFAGQRRTQQLGIVSAISNLSLVLATALAGYLASVEWRLSFLVYAFSIVSLVLAIRLKRTTPNKIELAMKQSKTVGFPKKSYLNGRFKSDYPFSLMIFYFVITTAVLAVPMDLSMLMSHYNIGTEGLSGTLISIFFLAITLPGFFINKLISGARQGARERNNLIWLGSIILGSLFVLFHSLWSSIIGIVLMGFGYGVMQPLIYDRTSEESSPQRTTFHLALVMTMNYLAIILYPFTEGLIEKIVDSNSTLIPFIMSASFGLLYWIYDFRKVSRLQKTKA